MSNTGDEDDHKRFEDVKKRAEADVFRGRSFPKRVRDVTATAATTSGRDDKWPWQ